LDENNDGGDAIIIDTRLSARRDQRVSQRRRRQPHVSIDQPNHARTAAAILLISSSLLT